MRQESSVRRLRVPHTAIKAVGGLVAFGASLAAVLSFVSDSPWFWLVGATAKFVLPEGAALLAVVVGATWLARCLGRSPAFIRSLTKLDVLILGACMAIALVLMVQLLPLELVRARRLRYLAGPALVHEFEARQQLEKAYVMAGLAKSLPWNQRYRSTLDLAETRLKEKALLERAYSEELLRQGRTSTTLQEIDAALLAFYLYPDSPSLRTARTRAQGAIARELDAVASLVNGGQNPATAAPLSEEAAVFRESLDEKSSTLLNYDQIYLQDIVDREGLDAAFRKTTGIAVLLDWCQLSAQAH